MNPCLKSHCLAHGPSLTPQGLTDDLLADKSLGYGGMVIVPALADQEKHSPKSFALIFEETGMKGLVCGFNAGNGPDPLGEHYELARDNLRKQARFAVALAEIGRGPAILVGPVHTHHMTKRPTWNQGNFGRWMDQLQGVAQEFDIRIFIEPLNSLEDGTPSAFETVFDALRIRGRLGLQWDMGHAYMQLRGHAIETALQMSSRIGYFEWANVGRHPLEQEHGIDFEAYAAIRKRLPANCEEGVEPFDPSVIQAFGLQDLCTTTTKGPECLALDIAFLRRLGVVKSAD